MHTTLIVPTLNRYDLLVGFLASIIAGTKQPDKIYIIDNGGKCPSIPYAEIIRPECNLGVAASWNLGLSLAKEVAIISNDDVTVRKPAVENILRYASAYPIVCCRGGAPGVGQCWSFFLQRPEIVEKVGRYDEAFWPAYFEDADYAWRMGLAGLPIFIAPDVVADQLHGFGSSTKHLDSRQHELFKAAIKRNERRYINKWGGTPMHEVYRRPFNRLSAPVPNHERPFELQAARSPLWASTQAPL